MTGFIIALVLIAVVWTLLYRGIGLVACTGVTAAVLKAHHENGAGEEETVHAVWTRSRPDRYASTTPCAMT